MSKSEAIHVGSLKRTDFKPFQNDGLMWKENSFSYLGFQFSLNTRSLYELKFVPKLNQIQQTLNCWRCRSLSLIGRSLLLKVFCCPNYTIYFLCCVFLFQNHFSKDWILFSLNLFGMVGNDRVKRAYLSND